MFENVRNIKLVGSSSGLPLYELEDISMEKWNEMAERQAAKAKTAIQSKEHYTIDSREVAEMVEKNHFDLLRDIKTYIKYLGESSFAFTDFFIESTYISNQNKTLLCYQVTKMGCEMIANKTTGKKGILFTAAYVKRFNNMENPIHTPQPMQMGTPDNALADRLERLISLIEQQHTQAPQMVLQPSKSNNKYMTREEMMNYLNMSASSINRILAQDDFPARVRIGGEILVDRKLLDQWIKEQKGSLTHRKAFNMNDLRQKRLLTKSEAAFYLEISIVTFNDVMNSNNFYPLVRIGHNRGRVFINREKLDQWIDEQDGNYKSIRK